MLTFIKTKVIFVCLFLTAAICLSYGLPVLSAKTEQIKESTSQEVKEVKQDLETVSNLKWSEKLKLRDFYLFSGFPELKDRITSYRDILAKNYEQTPDVFSTAIEYGILLLDLGELDKAQVVWDRALKDFKTNPTPKVYKAWLDAYKGDYLSAKNTWHQIIKEKLTQGVNATLWFPHHVDSLLGLYLIKDDLPQKDKEEVEQTIEEVTKYFAPASKLGAIIVTNYLHAGQLKKAAEALKKALDKNPDDTISLTLLGVTELISGHNEEALKLFDKVNEIYPNSPTNNLMRARALFALGREKESDTAIDQAIKLDPSWKKVKKKKFLTRESYIVQSPAIVPES